MEGQNKEADKLREHCALTFEKSHFSLSIQAGAGSVPVCAVTVDLLSHCVHDAACVPRRCPGLSLKSGSSAH